MNRNDVRSRLLVLERLDGNFFDAHICTDNLVLQRLGEMIYHVDRRNDSGRKGDGKSRVGLSR